jgi:hypothetical protein
MGKGAKGQQLANSGTAQERSGTLYNQSQSDYNFLDPQLQQEATNPQGYTPQQKAYMNTADSQSLGGGVAATTGQANLESARTRNAGGFQGAVGTADRASQRQLSQNSLGIEKSQADLQQAQKQQALLSLQSLYGQNSAEGLGYLNSSNTALNNENNAPNFWQQFLQDSMGAGAKLGAAKLGQINA